MRVWKPTPEKTPKKCRKGSPRTLKNIAFALKGLQKPLNPVASENRWQWLQNGSQNGAQGHTNDVPEPPRERWKKKTQKKHEDCLKMTSKRPTGGIRKKNMQKGNHFFPKMSEKGPRRDPKAVPESIKIWPFLDLCSAPETSKAGFYWLCGTGSPPFFHKIATICQKNAIKKFIEKTPSTKWSRTSKWSPGDSQNVAKMEPTPLKNEVWIRSWKAIRKKNS